MAKPPTRQPRTPSSQTTRSAKKAASRTRKTARLRRGPKRVCILTGGGDAPGLNAVLRGFVKTGTQLGLDVYGSEDGFEGLIQADRLVKLDNASVRGILPRGGSVLGCSNRANPFAYPMRGARGKEVYADVSEVVLRRLREHEIDVLVLVGGDGTMTHAHALLQRGVAVVGVPKTIDNDLAATDYTFGFDSALHTATWAIDALHSTAEAHDRVMILEVMGRDAGWIALCSGIAGGADVILIPEVPYDIDRVVAQIERRSQRGATFSIVVVGEGAYPEGGKAATLTKGRKGHLPRLGGAGEQVAKQLEGRVKHEVRVTVLGHLQRGGSPSPFDRLLGSRFGVRAAELCFEGKTGRMVALRGTEIVDVAIDPSVTRTKRVPTTGELIRVAQRLNIEVGTASSAELRGGPGAG